MINPTDHELLRHLMAARTSDDPDRSQAYLANTIERMTWAWRKKHGLVLPPKGGA